VLGIDNRRDKISTKFKSEKTRYLGHEILMHNCTWAFVYGKSKERWTASRGRAYLGSARKQRMDQSNAVPFNNLEQAPIPSVLAWPMLALSIQIQSTFACDSFN
jgi:hypothetical protein